MQYGTATERLVVGAVKIRQAPVCTHAKQFSSIHNARNDALNERPHAVVVHLGGDVHPFDGSWPRDELEAHQAGNHDRDVELAHDGLAHAETPSTRVQRKDVPVADGG
jgi:hypothetical protein